MHSLKMKIKIWSKNVFEQKSKKNLYYKKRKNMISTTVSKLIIQILIMTKI